LATALGFRQDTSPFIYLFSVALMLAFLVEKHGKAALMSAVIFALILIIYPIIFYDFWREIGTNIYHFFLLGQTIPFMPNLHLGLSSYVFGYRYNDAMTLEIVRLFVSPTLELGT